MESNSASFQNILISLGSITEKVNMDMQECQPVSLHFLVMSPDPYFHFISGLYLSNHLKYFKDGLPYLFHSFRNKYFNKISLGNMLYFQNKL